MKFDYYTLYNAVIKNPENSRKKKVEKFIGRLQKWSDKNVLILDKSFSNVSHLTFFHFQC